MPASRTTQLLCSAALLVLVLVQLTAHEGPAKDWLTILLGAIVVVLGTTSFVLARREAPSRSDRTH